jgi:hypothetical protein
MEYAANNLANANYGQGLQQGAALGSLRAPEAPRTIASAASRMEGVNERLAKVSESLSIISGQLGTLSGVGVSAGDTKPAPCGAVGRLNDAADAAHRSLSEIEQLISGIGRSLG